MNVVTGVFSFTGRYIAERLLAEGEPVKTLSRKPDPGHPLSDRVSFGPLQFDEDELTKELRGAETLFNTYWIRFPRGDVTWDTVLENTRVILRAARAAGVRRVVQFSVTNAAESSRYAYFRYKALAEREVRSSGISHAIVRPTLISGPEDILVNNVAWALRRFPCFLVPSSGDYRVQPVFAADVAAISVAAARETESFVIQAAGPDEYTFSELVTAVRQAIGSRCRLVACPPRIVLTLSGAVGRLRGDTLITREELGALSDSLLTSDTPTQGKRRFGDWLGECSDVLGRGFASELERNWR